MPTTLNDITVTYSLLNHPGENGACQGKMDADGREETVSFLIQFSDLNAFLEQIKGKPTSYGEGSTGTITRTEPLQNPWNKNLYAVSANYRVVGSDNNVTPSRPWAEVVVDVTFGALKWFPNDPSQPFLVRRYRGAGKMVTAPGTAYTFATTGNVKTHDVGIRVGAHVIEITRLELPSLDNFLAVAEPLEGCVNSDTITLGKRVYSPGYLLFETFSADIQDNGLGGKKAQATIVLHYSNMPWNSDFDYDGVVRALSPNKYTTAALSPLFT